MQSLILLIPVALLLIGIAIAALLWAISNGQFEDLDRAAHDILFDDSPPASDASEPTTLPLQTPDNAPPQKSDETEPGA